MRFILLLSCLLLSGAPAFAQTAEDSQTDEASVRDVIVRSYIDGLHRNRDAQAVRAGFHQDFLMHVYDDGELIQVTLDMWLDHLELDGDLNASTIEYEFKSIDVTGSAATVKLEVYEDGDHIYTDYFGLYKFGGAWRIVNKIFYDHD